MQYCRIWQARLFLNRSRKNSGQVTRLLSRWKDMQAERSFIKADLKWSRMDHFDELDEPLISSSGRKRKIKAETFLQNLVKAARFNGEGKALCTVCNHIHTVYDHNNNNVCQASTLAFEEITKIKCVFVFYSKSWNMEWSAFAIKQTFYM